MLTNAALDNSRALKFAKFSPVIYCLIIGRHIQNPFLSPRASRRFRYFSVPFSSPLLVRPGLRLQPLYLLHHYVLIFISYEKRRTPDIEEYNLRTIEFVEHGLLRAASFGNLFSAFVANLFLPVTCCVAF